MGRLIDEDELIKGRVENDPVVIAAKCTPTAYDPDNVLEQLETEDSKIEIQYENNYEKGLLDGIEKAIEIVKGGGVE